MAGDRIADGAARDAPWHARLAALLAASGRHDSAASHYLCALRGLDARSNGDGPEDGAQTQRQRLQWQFELAATEAKRGRRTDAMTLYEHILQQDCECVEALVNLAAQLAIADAERLDEALDLCARALMLQPSCKEAHYNRNMLLRRLGRQREAVRACWGYLARDIGLEEVRDEMPEELAREMLSFETQSEATKADKKIDESKEDDACNQEKENGGIAVVCVKWGTKYGAEYVNKLYNSAMRHCGELHLAFVCLTDNADGIDIHGNLTILPLAAGWKGWWNKCQLFSSSLSSSLRAMGHSRCLYIDLDTVIVGSMTDLLTWSPPPGVLALLKTDQMANEQREGGQNSSVMAWRIDNVEGGGKSLQFIYKFLQAHFAAVNSYIYKFDHWLEMAHPDACFLEDMFPRQIVEYRSLDDKAAAPPPSARIVCFPLLPKPHRATAPWVAQHWT